MSNTHHAHHILVPVKPTPEMLLAGHHKIDWCRDGQKTNVMEDPSQVEVISGHTIGTTCKQDLADAWEAMLAAAPPAPAALEGVADFVYAMTRALDRAGLKEAGWSDEDIADAMELIAEPSAPSQATVEIILPIIAAHVAALTSRQEAEDGLTVTLVETAPHLPAAGSMAIRKWDNHGLPAGTHRLHLHPPTPSADKLREAVADIAAERERQIEVEGRTTEADDGYRNGELAAAASAYAFSAATRTRYLAVDPLGFWPWSPEWFKPKDLRSDLVRAGALIVAEIERLDRAKLLDEDEAENLDCPICKARFKADDLCLTDIDLGPCHAECLADSPAVDLDTGEPLPEGAASPTPYRYDLTRPADSSGGRAA